LLTITLQHPLSLKHLSRSGSCASLYSNTVSITIDQPTIAGVLSGDATVCASANNGTVSLTGQIGKIQHWETSTDNGVTWNVLANTNNFYNYNNLSATTSFRALVQNNSCVALYSNVVKITVDVVTVAGMLSGNATLCASANSGTISLTGHTGNILQWQSSVDNGNTWATIANTTNNLVYNNLTTSTLFKTLIQSGSCASLYSNTVSLSVDQPTIAGVLSGDATVCASANNGTVSLTGQIGNIQHWETSTDNGVTWNVLANTNNFYNYNNLSATTSFRALVQNNSCAALYSNVVKITVDAPTVAGTLSGNATLCASANSGTISLTGYTGNILQWQSSVDNGNTWSIIANTTNSLAYNNLTTSTLFKTLIQSGSCASLYSNTVSIIVDQPTIAGILSGDATVCASANSGIISLTGQTGGIQQWETSIDNGATWNILANTNNFYNYNNLSATTSFRALVQNNSCVALYSNVVKITVDLPTVAGTLSGNATVCASANSGIISLTGSTGNILHWESSVDNGTNWTTLNHTANSFTYNQLATSTLFRALVQNNTCASAYSNNILITVDQPTVAGMLSASATVCATANSGTLSLTGYTGNMLQWETSPDNGNTWVNLANTGNQYNYSNITATTAFRVLVQNNVCAPAYSNSIHITADQTTMAGTLSGSATVCASANNGALSLSGSAGNILHWESSTDNGNTWIPVSNTGTTLSYLNLQASTLFRTLIQNGSCASLYSNSVAVTVDQPTIAGLLSGNATVCASSNSGTLSLAGHTGNIIHWESSNDNGNTWTTIANTGNTLPYNNLSASVTYRVLIQNGSCAALYSNTVLVTVSPATVPGLLTGDQTICASSNSGSVLLSGFTGNILQWETSIDNGVNWSIISGTANQHNYNNLSVTTLFRVLVQSNVCAPAYSNQVKITVDQPTIAGLLSGNAVVCASSNSGTIALSGFTGSIQTWESSLDNGNNWSTISNTASQFSYQDLTVSTLFRVLVQSGICASLRSNSVSITVNQPSVGGTLSVNATVCASANSGTLTLTGSTGNILKWESSDNNGASWTAINNTGNQYSYNNLNTTTWFRALVQNNVCASAYSNKVIITVDQPTAAGSLSGDATVCATSNNGTIALTGSTGNILQWETSPDNGSTWLAMANTNNQHTYHDLAATTAFRVLVQNSVCSAAYSNKITVAVDQSSIAGSITGSAVICATANSGLISLTGYQGNIMNWVSSTNNGNVWTTLPYTSSMYTYQNISADIQYKAMVKNGVCPAVYSTPAVIAVSKPVDISKAGPDQVLCSINTIVLAANNPVSGNGQWVLVSGPSAVSFANASAYNTTVNGIAAGTYLFAWNISNGVCENSTDTVSVIAYAAISNTIDNGTKTVCKGQLVTVAGQLPSGGNSVYQSQWQKSYDGNTWENISNANTSDYSFTGDTSVFVRRSVTSQTCVVTSDAAFLKVQPALSNNTISGSQQVCKGTLTKAITGSAPVGGDGKYTYQWQQSTDRGANWTIIDKQNELHLNMTNAFTRTTWVRRIVTTQLCTGSFSNASNVAVIDVNPVTSGAVQYNGGVFCQLNTTIDFAPQALYTDSIRWNFGDGTIITTGPQKISHQYKNAGSYLPSIQLINSSTGCNTLLATTDTIYIDELKPGFNISAVYDCGKTTYRFTDTTRSYFPVVARTWLVNEKPVANAATIQQSFTTNGNNAAGIKVSTQYGCVASLEAKFNVSIYSYPKVDIDAVGQACLNNLMELKSIINSSDSVNTRIWNLGNGSSATDSVVLVSYFSEGKYLVKLTVSTINSCYDSALKQLNIHPIPKVTVKTDNIVCKGDSLELKANGAVNYIWKDQNENIVCNNCSTMKIAPQKNMQYKVIGYSEFGCSEIASTNVRVIQPFKLTAKTADTLCIGDAKKLNVSGASSYTWRADAGLNTYNSAMVLASPITTTTYRVTGRDDYNCFRDSADIKVTVGKPTQFTIGRDMNILSGTTVQLQTLVMTPDIKSWQWKGNATFSCINCAEPTAKVIMDECLSCTATNIYGCQTTDTICITTFCPSSEVFIPNAFTPDGDGVNDILYVQGRGIKLIKSFRVFSRWGELVFEKTNFLPGDKSSGWDGRVRGKLASPDVFVYVCEAICEKGTPAVFKGNTAILK
jgi:gliding motility-associated-like protein